MSSPLVTPHALGTSHPFSPYVKIRPHFPHIGISPTFFYSSYPLVAPSCHTHLSHRLVTHTRYTHLSHTLVTHTCHTHSSHTFVAHTCHTPLSHPTCHTPLVTPTCQTRHIISSRWSLTAADGFGLLLSMEDSPLERASGARVAPLVTQAQNCR